MSVQGGKCGIDREVFFLDMKSKFEVSDQPNLYQVWEFMKLFFIMESKFDYKIVFEFF